MKKDKIKKSENDQFYTDKSIAEYFLDVIKKRIPKKKRLLMIEPSAGTGSFLLNAKKLCEEILAFDIDPKGDDIVKQDFLKDNISIGDYKESQITVYGNPPFGRNCSDAIKFINKAAEISGTIAFILPRTFEKPRIQEKINKNLFLVCSEDVPKKSFVLNDLPYDVPCVFQIWEKNLNSTRESILGPMSNNMFDYCNKEDSDIAIIRVGGRTTKLKDKNIASDSSVYYIKMKNNYMIKDLQDFIDTYDFAFINNTAGVRSISKRELNNCINEYLKK